LPGGIEYIERERHTHTHTHTQAHRGQEIPVFLQHITNAVKRSMKKKESSNFKKCSTG
jgi:hypothetical protein